LSRSVTFQLTNVDNRWRLSYEGRCEKERGEGGAGEEVSGGDRNVTLDGDAFVSLYAPNNVLRSVDDIMSSARLIGVNNLRGSV